MKKITALFLTILICTSLAACGGGEDNGKSDLNLTELPPAEVMQTSIIRMMEHLSDEGVRGGLNLNAAFGIPSDIFSYNTAELELNVTSDDTQLAYGQRSVIAKNGAAEHSMKLDADGETMHLGAYFQDNAMLVQMADASQPMIRYSLTPEDAAAMSSLAPMERYQLCLRSDTPAQGMNIDWTAALRAVDELLTARQDGIATGTETVPVGEISFAADTLSLTLADTEAAEAFTAFINVWQQDFRCSDMLSMNDLMNQEDGALNTMERLNALAAQSEGASLSLKTGSDQNAPALLEFIYKCAAGECRLVLLFWSQGEDSYSSVSLRFPEGDGFDYIDVAKANGNSTTHTFYASDGTVMAESILSATTSGDNNNFSSQYTYAMTDYTNEDIPEGDKLESSGSYSCTETNDVIKGNFNGELLSLTDDVNTIVFSGAVTLSESYGEPIIPEFIEGSGKTAATRAELFELLSAGKDEASPVAEEMRKFERLPALSQTLSANLLLLEL